MHKRLFISFFILLFTSRMVMAGGVITVSSPVQDQHHASFIIKASLSNIECGELPCIDEDFGKKARQNLPVLDHPSPNLFVAASAAVHPVFTSGNAPNARQLANLIVLYRRILI